MDRSMHVYLEQNSFNLRNDASIAVLFGSKNKQFRSSQTIGLLVENLLSLHSF